MGSRPWRLPTATNGFRAARSPRTSSSRSCRMPECPNVRIPIPVEGVEIAPRFAVDTVPEAHVRAADRTSHPCNFVVSDRTGLGRLDPRVPVAGVHRPYDGSIVADHDDRFQANSVSSLRFRDAATLWPFRTMQDRDSAGRGREEFVYCVNCLWQSGSGGSASIVERRRRSARARTGSRAGRCPPTRGTLSAWASPFNSRDGAGQSWSPCNALSSFSVSFARSRTRVRNAPLAATTVQWVDVRQDEMIATETPATSYDMDFESDGLIDDA